MGRLILEKQSFFKNNYHYNTNRHKKIIFVDFNRVLSWDPFWHSLKNPNHQLHDSFNLINKFLFKDNPNIVNDWMIGKYSSEDIHKILSKNIGVSYELLFDVFKHDCKNIQISQKILNKLIQLKDNYYLILSTGNMDCFNRFTLPAKPLLVDIFDEIHNSYNFKLLKSSNDGEYFRNTIQNKKTIFKNCYLIDDSENTCKIFENNGGKAFCLKKESEILKCLDKL